MSVFRTAAKAFMSSYATAVKVEAPQAVLGMTKTVKAGERVVAVNVTGAAKAVPQIAKKNAVPVAKTVGAQLLGGAIALEIVDAVENVVDKRKRNAEYELLVQRIAAEGLSEEITNEIQVLGRADERRTFTQWVRDLPYRTTRRVARACLIELGFWYTVATTPIWAPVMAADALYSFAFVPAAAVVSKAFGHTLNVERALRGPRGFVNFIMRATFRLGMKLFTKGAEMRLYNRTATVANTTAYPVLEEARGLAHEKVSKIVDGHTAFAWGEELAEQIGRVTTTTEAAQRAYAQARYWVEENIVPQFIPAVTAGVRTGTPVVYRDLVSTAL